MKCEKCGAELVPKIYAIHITRCTAKPKLAKVKKDPELNIQRGLLKAELDAKGISYYPNAKTEHLLKLVNESKEEKKEAE